MAEESIQITTYFAFKELRTQLELHCAIGELDLVMGRVSEIRVVTFVGYAKRFIFIFSQIFTMMSFQSVGCRTLKTHQIWIKIDGVK